MNQMRWDEGEKGAGEFLGEVWTSIYRVRTGGRFGWLLFGMRNPEHDRWYVSERTARRKMDAPPCYSTFDLS